jgi:Domain of unknown function (DUF4412)
MASLEGWNFTIKLCPRASKLARSNPKAKCHFAEGSNGQLPEVSLVSALLFLFPTRSNESMKLALLSCFAVLFSLATARADLTITQKAEGAPGMGEVVIKIKGDKTRVEMSPQMTMIIDSKTGDVSTIMTDKRRVMRLSGDKAKAMAEMVNQFNKPAAAKPNLVATGKKETISGYEAEEYKVEGGILPATYWLTTKYPDYAAILKQLQQTKPSSWDPSKMGMPGYNELPGLPMRVVVQTPGQGSVTTTIVSIKSDPLTDDQFVVPKDFKQIEMPDFSKLQQQPASLPTEKKP